MNWRNLKSLMSWNKGLTVLLFRHCEIFEIELNLEDDELLLDEEEELDDELEELLKDDVEMMWKMLGIKNSKHDLI